MEKSSFIDTQAARQDKEWLSAYCWKLIGLFFWRFHKTEFGQDLPAFRDPPRRAINQTFVHISIIQVKQTFVKYSAAIFFGRHSI